MMIYIRIEEENENLISDVAINECFHTELISSRRSFFLSTQRRVT